MSLGCAAKGHGSQARILLVTPRPRLLGRGSTYLAYASYNTPSFVCVKPKLLDGGMALGWSYASSVWCGAVALLCFGNVWQAPIYFTVSSSQHSNGRCLLYSFSFPLVLPSRL